MMREAILNFNKQFEINIELDEFYKLHASNCNLFIICGMGGSALAADMMESWKPGLPLLVHKDYGLPPEANKNTLIISSSYSGNTEEPISSFNEALKRGFPLMNIGTCCTLEDLADKNNIFNIKIPDTGIQPRSSLGFTFIILTEVLNKAGFVTDNELNNVKELSKLLNPAKLEQKGKELAQELKGKVPIIYSSRRMGSLAYNWKISFNETGKIPSFYNVFPELNHNEMTGFDINDNDRELSDKFKFIFLKEREDHPRIQKRMSILSKMYQKRGLEVIELEFNGNSLLERMFNGLLTAHFTALYTAEIYGNEAEEVPMIEDFKKQMV